MNTIHPEECQIPIHNLKSEYDILTRLEDLDIWATWFDHTYDLSQVALPSSWWERRKILEQRLAILRNCKTYGVELLIDNRLKHFNHY